MEVLEGAAWFERLVDDLGSASSVTLASYTYDEPAIQAIMERRLRSRACEVEVMVDKEAHDAATTRFQRSRLAALRDLGARVRLCQGKPRSRIYGKNARGHGLFHKKVVVIDKRVLYHGSANCSRNSRCNEESVLRLTGPPVMCVLSGLEEARQASYTL